MWSRSKTAKVVPNVSVQSPPVQYGAMDQWRDIEWYRDVDWCLRSYRYREPDLDLNGDLRQDQRRDWLPVECHSDQYRERF
ncbi:unnamed protein product [Caretta caretta]